MNNEHVQHAIRSSTIPGNQRIHVTSTLFGLDFPLRLEPCVFGLARQLSEDYRGGLWEFHVLSNSGFYMQGHRT